MANCGIVDADSIVGAMRPCGTSQDKRPDGVTFGVGSGHNELCCGRLQLFTDGMANCGLTHTQSIVSAMEPYLATPTAPTIFTFGLGFNHNEGMLKAIAETGQGMYYYLERPSSIAPAFAECLGGL
eukprot:Sspe_Gene.28851::Locus_13281_Transcript_1_1_Confidence_1.000_Length_406::g.28851::m.28851